MRPSRTKEEHNEGRRALLDDLRYVRLFLSQTTRALTALVAWLAFVTEQSRGLRRSDSLLQFFDFQTDFRIDLHVFSPPFWFGVSAIHSSRQL